MLMYGISMFGIVIFLFSKIIGYIEEMVSSIEQLFTVDTELVSLPAELKDVEDKLNKIKYISQENKRLAMEAEQKKNDLVSYLAHDLKTPLTSVIGYITLLHDEQEISKELRQKYLNISLKKAERLEELINEFFEITRFNINNITLEPTKINLTRMLEQINFEFKPFFTTKNLSCFVKADKDVEILGDAKKLERVFDNLIRNAINYSFENSEIRILQVQTEQGVSIRFINHGNTIPPNKLIHIFEQFYRVDTSRNTKNGGSGLGLAISKEIVELHSGSIVAFSENQVIEINVFLPYIS